MLYLVPEEFRNTPSDGEDWSTLREGVQGFQVRLSDHGLRYGR
jgi:hypothetical protein